jgi:transposase InsO family protein
VVREGEHVKFAFIRDSDGEERRKPRKERIPVSLMCEVLDVSRSGFYAWLKRDRPDRKEEDAELTGVIKNIHEDHKGRLGIGRLVTELAKLGRRHSPRRVRRLARAAGLTCVHPRPYRATTIQDKANSGGLVDLVGREFVPNGPNQLWFTDITYIRMWGGWAYLASIIDGYSRKIVGWSVDSNMRTNLVTDALRMAIERQRPGIGDVVIHSDRGCQYTSTDFRALALANGIIPSVGHTGICYDNAMAESFNATIKKELIHLHTWPTLRAVRNAVFEYIEVYYNRKRPHSSIGNVTPSEMEHNSLRTIDSEMAATA